VTENWREYIRQHDAAARQNAQYIRLEALKLSRDIAVGNEPAAITLDRAKQFHDFLTEVGK
jgi:hypothetical protein